MVTALVLLAALLDVPSESEHPGLLSALLALPLALPLLWRRSHPLTAFCVVIAVVVGVGYDIPYPSIATALIACYSLAVYSPHWQLSLALLATVTVVIDLRFSGPLPRIPSELGPFLLLGLPWAAGNAARLRQQQIDTAESRALRLEHERDAAEAALRSERTRIARDLHDVVAHSVSVMVVQAGAARQVVRSKPDRAVEALLAVEESGREALTELRNVLGLLTESVAVPLAPQPGIDAVNALVERIRAAGLSVNLHVEGTPRRLPPGVDVAAYRVVQEALTNALRHSGAATDVAVIYGDNVVELSVVDAGPPPTGRAADTWGLGDDPGAGHGLVGMRERVALYGGTLEAGPVAGGGYRVHARIPIDRGAFG